MQQEHVLSILYELSMVMSGATRSEPLIDNFLQRLMFHTGLPCGLFVEDIRPVTDKCADVRLDTCIGDPQLSSRCQSVHTIPRRLVSGDSAILDLRDMEGADETLGSEWQSCLRLRISDDSAFLLLSTGPIDAQLPLTQLFNPVLANFHRVLQLCRNNEAHMQALEVSNRELEAFSYSISHDLRTPLRAIDGFSQLLLDDYSDCLDGEGAEYLNRIRGAAQHMGNLIDDILALSRTSRAELEREAVSLSMIAQDISNSLRSAEPQRRVSIHIASGLYAYADQALCRMVLENLLGNAWKYSSREDRAEITLTGELLDGQRTFIVTDNGVGFDMRYTGKLFQPFQRLHHDGEFPGTGVGLATVKRIIDRHGGRIWCHSELGEGARFYFTLSDDRQEGDAA